MSETNERTLDSYNKHLQEYIENTPQRVESDEDIKLWIDTALAMLPRDGSVLEIGSAFGRDADYIEGKGFEVTRTDAAKSFVDYLNRNEKPVKLLNIITDEIEEEFDMVFANAVFLHLTPNELEIALRKIHTALNKRGILVFSMKRGEGSRWTDAKLDAPRFFQYWEPEQLEEVLKSNGFEIDWSSDETDDKWLHIIARPR